MAKRISQKYLKIIKDEKKKVNKSRKQYAEILSMPESMDYLIGQVIRVLPNPSPEGFLQGIVQKDGYRRLVLSFTPDELKMLDKKPKLAYVEEDDDE